MIRPATPESFDDVLKALNFAGLDKVLEVVGTELGFEGLTCVHVSLLLFSKSPIFLSDEDLARGVSLLVQLNYDNLDDPDNMASLGVHDKNDFVMGQYVLRVNEGLVVHGGVYNTIESFDYHDFENYRFLSGVVTLHRSTTT